MTWMVPKFPQHLILAMCSGVSPKPSPFTGPPVSLGITPTPLSSSAHFQGTREISKPSLEWPSRGTGKEGTGHCSYWASPASHGRWTGQGLKVGSTHSTDTGRTSKGQGLVLRPSRCHWCGSTGSHNRRHAAAKGLGVHLRAAPCPAPGRGPCRQPPPRTQLRPRQCPCGPTSQGRSTDKDTGPEVPHKPDDARTGKMRPDREGRPGWL